MPDGWQLLFDLIVTLIVALILGVLMEKLRQSPIVGYLLAGLLIGPGAFGLIQGLEAVQVIADVGVALLLFTIGLEFSWRKLVQMGAVALGGGTIQVIGTTAVGFGIARLCGLDWKASLFIGMLVTMSSTSVVLRVLKDRGDFESVHGRAATGVTLLQDIALVPMLIVAGFLASPREQGLGRFAEAGAQGALFLAVLVVVVGLLLPRLLNASEFARNRELPILTAVGTCVGATWAAHAAGLSPTLGAFLAGMLLAESRYADQIRADVYPLRTVFVTIFFASMGSFANLGWIVENAGLVLLTTAAVMMGKALLVYLALRPFLRGAIVPAIAAAVTLGQLGEFSFVIAKLGSTSGIFDPDLMQLVISVTIVSLLLTPTMVAGAPRLARGLAKRLWPARALARSERVAQALEGLAGHAVIAGFGAAGQAAAAELRSCDAEVVVLDVDPRLVELATQQGRRARVADATQAPNLIAVGIDRARCLIVAIPDHRTARLVISQAKALNPQIHVIARGRYAVFAAELDLIGADVVVNEEVQVGEQLGREAARWYGGARPHEPIPGASLR